MRSQDHLARRILTALETTRPTTQRALSSEVGIALGLTNLIIRRLVEKGWVKVQKAQRRQFLYLITPAGLLAKARLSREYFHHTVKYYRETRDRIRERFLALSASLDDGTGEACKRIVFVGAGEVAEIGYVCLQETDMDLVGVVDDGREHPFFGQPVHKLSALQDGALDGNPVDCVVVMSFAEAPGMAMQLAERGFSGSRVFFP